jgi:splicing factor 3B subunit 3
MIPKLGLKLKQDVIPLTYTPRRFASHPYHPLSYIVETDHRSYGQAAIDRIVGEKVCWCMCAKQHEHS